MEEELHLLRQQALRTLPSPSVSNLVCVSCLACDNSYFLGSPFNGSSIYAFFFFPVSYWLYGVILVALL